VERAEGLLIAPSSNHPSSPKKLRDLYGQFAGDSRRTKDEDIFTLYQLCAIGE
jgi:hypothetical protein